MNFLGALSALSLTLSFFFMAFGHEYRLASYSFLILFIFASLLALFLVKGRIPIKEEAVKVFSIFFAILALSVLQLCVTYISGSAEGAFHMLRIFYAPIVFLSLVVALGVWGVHWYTSKVCFLIIVFVLVSLALCFSRIYLYSMNFYASMLIIPVMYALLIGRKKLFLILSGMLLFLGVMFEARGAYLLLLLFVMTYQVNRVFRLSPLMMLSALLILLFVQFLLLTHESLQANIILSYRPSIWNYYYTESVGNFWFGGGAILNDVSEGAASYYQSMIGRGVGSAYGTQSMYMLYFYESGFFGLVVLFFVFYISFLTRSKYLVSVMSIAVLAFLETVKLGAISIYGLPLTYFLTLSLISKDKGKC